MPARRLIALTTAYTPILSTIFASQVKIAEVGSAAPFVGLLFKYPTDNFTAVETVLPQQQPKLLADPVARKESPGVILGRPAEVNTANTAVPAGTYPQTIPATTLCEVAALSATTTIWVEEFE